MSPLAFLDFGLSELLLVGVVSLLVFGGNLPEVMRTLGRNYAKLRQTLRQFSAPMREEMQKVRDMPTPEGIVSQVMEDDIESYPGSDGADEEASDDGESLDNDVGYAVTEEASEDAPAKKKPASDDLLDEGPLV